MSTVVNSFFSVVVIKVMLFSVGAMAAAMTDLREEASSSSAKKIEIVLNSGMYHDGIKYYEINPMSDYSGSSNSCDNTAFQKVRVNYPAQVIDLMNSMPVAQIMFSIDGYNDSGLVKSWVFLTRKSIGDQVAKSNNLVDLSNTDFNAAKTMVDNVVSVYDKHFSVEAYQIEYRLPNSNETRLFTTSSPAELSAMLDQLAAGNYQLNLKVIQDSGKISNLVVAINKLEDDIVAENVSLQLAWQTPSSREDGSPLSATDIAGYEIYYTAIAADNTTVDQLIEVSGAEQSSYTMQDVAVGEYHFAVATIDVNGMKSQISDVISTIVN